MTERGSPRLLVVEDDLAVASGLLKGLSRAGFDVTLAMDGDQAWEQLRKGSYDVLVTDQVMPRIRGHALVSRVRSHQALAQTPAIILGQVHQEADPLTLTAGKLDANALNTAIHSLVEGGA